MRVIIACRLSKLHDGSTGLDSQETETVRLAEAEGHEVVAVVQDAVSGAKDILRRKRLKPWMTEPEYLSRYDGIVVYRMDRLTRGDSAETRRIEDWADANGKSLMTADGLVFPCEGADGIRWDLAKRIAHDEWLRIRERYGRMQASVRSRGGYIGKTPFAMTLKPNGQGAKALARSEQWHLIEHAFELTPRMRLADIGAWLSEQTGMQWHERTVLRLLRNPAYSSVPGYLRAQSVLDARAQMGRAAVGEKALLSRLLCGREGCDATGPKPSPMYRIRTRSGVFYRCAGRGPRRHGCGNIVPLAVLDRLVLHGLEWWWREPHIERVFVPGDDVSEQIEALKARLPHARSRKDADALWDQIEALQAKGSTPPRWEERDSGMSIGEYLAGASLTEQRTFLAAKDIRAWHEGPQVLCLVDGALARTGGRTAVGDEDAPLRGQNHA
jgi:DNA invertase Pin-like site-specific DNA recombinase